MSNFKLVTLEHLQDPVKEINWSFCYICQNEDRNNLQDPSAKRGEFL